MSITLMFQSLLPSHMDMFTTIVILSLGHILNKEKKMKIKKILILIIAIMVNACCSGRVLTKNDYKQMTEEEMRDVLLRYTPIGSSKAAVEKFIKEQVCQKYKVKNGSIVISRKNYYPKQEDGDFNYEVYFAYYGLLSHFFTGNYVVRGFWIFNKNGILKDVQVIRYFDGL